MQVSIYLYEPANARRLIAGSVFTLYVVLVLGGLPSFALSISVSGFKPNHYESKKINKKKTYLIMDKKINAHIISEDKSPRVRPSLVSELSLACHSVYFTLISECSGLRLFVLFVCFDAFSHVGTNSCLPGL